ncbi:MAG: hypothetical protein HYZ34_01285 [Ignavibacteriae bacterium]|nr:hypothetical protein [Ignavibacteriota bacterium]
MFSLSCKEELPVYVQPANVFSVQVELVEQLPDRVAPPGAQMVRLKLVGENIYDEVFFDSVNIRGILNISWLRTNGRKKTIEISEKDFLNRDLIMNRKMMLLPGQKFGLQFFWNLRGDDSVYFPAEMSLDYAYLRDCGRYTGYKVLCSNPEEMIVEGTISLYKNIDVVSIQPFTFWVTRRSLEIP